MNKMFNLTHKVAVVIGGSGGIGSAQAIELADAGADVVVVDLAINKLDQVVNKIREKGRKSSGIVADITQERPVQEMVEKVLTEFSHIDILVNAAGISIRKPAIGFPIDDWQQVIDVNTRGTFICCKFVGEVMIKQKSGKIINLSSVRGRYGLKVFQAAYCPSKGAVDALTRTLACEWARYNVLVNAIAPCVVQTDFTSSALSDPEVARNLKAQIPLGRWAMPEDIVGLTVFLASKASDFITGQIIYIDGGMTACL